jgi:hypothetical protein
VDVDRAADGLQLLHDLGQDRGRRGLARELPLPPGVSTPSLHDKNTQHLGKSHSKRPHKIMWKRPLTIGSSVRAPTVPNETSCHKRPSD